MKVYISMLGTKAKLTFEIKDSPGDISLEQAIAGDIGCVSLGNKGVSLWVPGDIIPLEQEIVFDMRTRPLSHIDVQTFRRACEGRFMNVHIALVNGTDEARIARLLQDFDYVLTPIKRIKNTPQDFEKRILSYSIPDLD